MEISGTSSAITIASPLKVRVSVISGKGEGRALTCSSANLCDCDPTMRLILGRMIQHIPMHNPWASVIGLEADRHVIRCRGS